MAVQERRAARVFEGHTSDERKAFLQGFRGNAVSPFVVNRVFSIVSVDENGTKLAKLGTNSYDGNDYPVVFATFEVGGATKEIEIPLSMFRSKELIDYTSPNNVETIVLDGQFDRQTSFEDIVEFIDNNLDKKVITKERKFKAFDSSNSRIYNTRAVVCVFAD